MHNIDESLLFTHPEIRTLKELLRYTATTHATSTAFAFQEQKENKEISYTQFKADVDALGSYLFSQGYRSCHIAVLGENSYSWILTHFATTCGGNVIVPIDKDLSAREIVELLVDSNSKLLVYSSALANIVEEVKAASSDLAFISTSDIPALLEAGHKLIADGYSDYLDADVGENDLASIVYTSGTTGKPKGVMLTHGNFALDSWGSCRYVTFDDASIVLLPLHHTFGLTATIFNGMLCGCSLYINKSYKNLLRDFQREQPTGIIAVPLIVETLYKMIWSTARKQGKEKQLAALIKISDCLRKIGIDLRNVFFRSITTNLGGKLKWIVSGGAPLSTDLIKSLDSLGITILNGYGITECAPIVSTNAMKRNILGSAGFPLPYTEVKIADNGEILVKGPHVMSGYYHNDAENEKAFRDGWLKTGDLGELDEFGALHIVGRIKNLIILSSGENIPAESIEQEVYTIPYVKECVAYGQDNKIVVEVFLDEEETAAADNIHADIDKINRRLPQIKNIGKVVVRDTEFPKTTTKKIKRNYGGQ